MLNLVLYLYVLYLGHSDFRLRYLFTPPKAVFSFKLKEYSIRNYDNTISPRIQMSAESMMSWTTIDDTIQYSVQYNTVRVRYENTY